jgi:chromosome segregation ATPase
MNLKEVKSEMKRLQELANSLPERRAEVQKEYDDLCSQPTLPKYAAGLITKAEKDQVKARIVDLQDWLSGYDKAHGEIQQALKPLRQQEHSLENQDAGKMFRDNLDSLRKKAKSMFVYDDDLGKIMISLGLNTNQMDQVCQGDEVMYAAWTEGA